MSFEYNWLEVFIAASALDLESLLVGILDPPEYFVGLLCVLELLLDFLDLARLVNWLLGAFTKALFGG